MALIWHLANGENWVSTELDSAAVLTRDSLEPIDDMAAAARDRGVLLCAHPHDGHAAAWVLLAPSSADVWINDARLAHGIRVLSDRDAIRISGSSAFYFSTEKLACVEAFPAAEPVFCPRCKLEIAAGDAAVCCPQCGIWHHERVSEEQACWTYAKTCALCDQSTHLEIEKAAFRWTPEWL